MRQAVICLMLLVASEFAVASPLLGAKALRCQTAAGTATTWEVGHPNSEASESVLAYSVQDIDTARGRATMVGRGGSAQVTVVRTASTLSFLEQASKRAMEAFFSPRSMSQRSQGQGLDASRQWTADTTH